MRRLALAAALVLALVAPADAEERIENFISDVTVNADASLAVRETITVDAEGSEIRHGILRDFPTTYTDRHGVRVRAGFEVLEVKRDGRPEPYALEWLSNGRRIRIGDKDVYVAPGRHTYEILYTTTRQIGFFPDYDELYWNVTGNGWTFAIQHAAVVIRLPSGARIVQHAAYTGYQGISGDDFAVTSASGNQYRAETTRRLEPNEGFTVAVAWPKGFVTPPSGSDRIGWWISDNAGYAGLALTLIAAALYFFVAWDRVGRDPPAGPIVPLFYPPKGISPAGTRFIWRQNYDDRALAAELVSLAVKGRLTISDDDGYTVTKGGTADAAAAGSPLTAAENALYQAIPNGSTAFQQSNHQKLRTMKAALAANLTRDYEGTMFVRNLSWFWQGAAISVAGLAISLFLMPGASGGGGLFVIGWSAIWWGVIVVVAVSRLKGLLSGGGILAKIGALLPLLFLIPFIGAGIAVPVGVLWAGQDWTAYVTFGTAFALLLLNLLFFYLLRAPTMPGRKLLDAIEGFRMYMTTAEEERLKVLHPPEKTPQLFERYLPFAMALDCENAWNAKFAAVLAAAAAAGAAAPSWYQGSHWGSSGGGFGGSLGSSLSASVSSASTAPGSSSGSGGGGSSGGGGGGGGGSGW